MTERDPKELDLESEAGRDSLTETDLIERFPKELDLESEAGRDSSKERKPKRLNLKSEAGRDSSKEKDLINKKLIEKEQGRWKIKWNSNNRKSDCKFMI